VIGAEGAGASAGHAGCEAGEALREVANPCDTEEIGRIDKLLFAVPSSPTGIIRELDHTSNWVFSLKTFIRELDNAYAAPLS
jgi:hypothetical protein